MTNAKDRQFAVVEKIFQYKGHECICIFTRLGCRCGYVSVDDDLSSGRYHERYDHTKLDYACHGGLSFGGRLPFDYGQTKSKYIGFDCGHYFDGADFEQAYEYGLITEEEWYRRNDDFYYLIEYPVCSLDYVEQNCKKLVDQIIGEEEK